MKKQDYYPVTNNPYELELGKKHCAFYTVVSQRRGFVGWMTDSPDQPVNDLNRDGTSQPVNINQITQEDVLRLLSEIQKIKIGKALALETILRKHRRLANKIFEDFRAYQPPK